MERRLTAILAADVVGYSRLMGEDEVGTLARLKTCRRELVDPAIEEFHGRIVKLMGDGALVEFAQASSTLSNAPPRSSAEWLATIWARLKHSEFAFASASISATSLLRETIFMVTGSMSPRVWRDWPNLEAFASRERPTITRRTKRMSALPVWERDG